MVPMTHVGYSGVMETLTAPDLTPGYPSKGGKLGPAWNDLWKAIQEAEGPVDGRTLADRIAPQHDLQPSTLNALLSRMKAGGHLQGEPKIVDVEVHMKDGTTRSSKRVRTHYSIAR